jgi:protein translocase, SecG subunit
MILTVIIIDIIICVALTAMVLIQTGKTSGLSGALGGGGDTFLAKNKSKTLDAMLARMTKWGAAAFIIITLILNIVIH